jgi:peptidoglycan DL-endopeptidase CwlO
MSRRSRPTRALVLVVAATVGLTTPAGPAFANTDYPTWHDVETAKHNESAKRAEIARISALIAGLDTEAATLAKAALEKAEEYN